MRKRYIKDGVFWNGNDVEIDGMTIVNPSEEQLAEAGYVEYVEPEPPVPTPEELLEQAKTVKLSEIEAYDSSDAVNSFTIGGQTMWLTVDERQQIATQISASEAVGRESMTRWFGGVAYTFALAVWQRMLVALEVYAGDALNVTEAHKQAVRQMTSVEEVEAFDITADYPDKPNFPNI